MIGAKMSERDDVQSPTWSAVETRDAGRVAQDTGRTRVPVLTIAGHADLRRLGAQVLVPGLAAGEPCPVSRLEPRFREEPDGAERALDDPFVSRNPVLLEPTVWGVRVCPPKGGAAVTVNDAVVVEPVELSWEQVDEGVALELAGRVTLILGRREQAPGDGDPMGLVGGSERIERVRADIRALAGRELPTLLQGETGTGKELAARAIHRISPRADRPFVSVNMAAIPVATAVSQLFGHAKGAFTGAVSDHPGFFGQADGGTLFLDEVGDMPMDVQVALLRVLEAGEIQPVGARATRTVDVRLISATDSDLEAALEQDRFRGSLLHRLGVFHIELPALRHRREDIPRLLLHFLREELEREGDASRLAGSPADVEPWFPAGVMTRLVLHPWPGNVRQLRNIARQLAVHVDRPVSLEPGSPLARLVAERPRRAPRRSHSQPAVAAVQAETRPSEIDETTLATALADNRYNVGATARQLGISRTSLYALMEKSSTIRKAGDLTQQDILAARELVGDDTRALAQHLKVSQQGLARRMRDVGL